MKKSTQKPIVKKSKKLVKKTVRKRKKRYRKKRKPAKRKMVFMKPDDMINMKNSTTTYFLDMLTTHFTLKENPIEIPNEIIEKAENYERLRLSLLIWKMEKLFFDHYKGEEDEKFRNFFKRLKRKVDESNT